MIGDYNLYCDESCHLEHDGHQTMVLGSIWTDVTETEEATQRIKEIKKKHGIKPEQEVKWTKVSPSNLKLYLDLVDYFFDNANLHFRGLVVPDKANLDHKAFQQSHDDWYYKMYFLLLTAILKRDNHYNIYLDIKDTLGGRRIKKLEDVLANDKYDFERQMVKRIQLVRSHEVQLIQLADIFIGALMYKHRSEMSSTAKKSIVERIENRSGFSLTKSTLPTEDRFNLFMWRPGGIEL